jgi:hypothetical protein
MTVELISLFMATIAAIWATLMGFGILALRDRLSANERETQVHIDRINDHLTRLESLLKYISSDFDSKIFLNPLEMIDFLKHNHSADTLLKKFDAFAKSPESNGKFKDMSRARLDIRIKDSFISAAKIKANVEERLILQKTLKKTLSQSPLLILIPLSAIPFSTSLSDNFCVFKVLSIFLLLWSAYMIRQYWVAFQQDAEGELALLGSMPKGSS